jgi:hypothetical protein
MQVDGFQKFSRQPTTNSLRKARRGNFERSMSKQPALDDNVTASIVYYAFE